MSSQAEKEHRGANPWRIVFAIALVVFIASLVALGVIAYSYFQGQSKYSDIANTSGFKPDDAEDKQLAEIHVDWDALLAANPDTVGWLYVPGTVINYPVVQGKDNDHYLTYDFDGEQGWLANYGAIFMDYRNKPDMTDQQIFIYGHHMNDGSMFADLAGFTDQARFDECRSVYLLTPQGNMKFKSFSLVHVPGDDAIVQTEFSTQQDMVAYIQDKIDNSVVAVSDTPPASNIRKALALATCDDVGEGRFILYSYLVDATTDDLYGDVGLETTEGETSGFTNDLAVQE